MMSTRTLNVLDKGFCVITPKKQKTATDCKYVYIRMGIKNNIYVYMGMQFS